MRLEHTKSWSLEEHCPRASTASLGVDAQFVVTKHHAYCVVAARGQALLVKLGGASQGLPEQAYTDRFPEKAAATQHRTRAPALSLTLTLPPPHPPP